MPFVREKTPEEFKQKHPEIRQYSHDWLIDRERELIFIYTGGNPRGNQKSFTLFVKGEPINIWSEWVEHGVGKDRIFEWSNTTFHTEESIDDKQIKAFVERAFQAYGSSGYGLKNIKEVTVTFK